MRLESAVATSVSSPPPPINPQEFISTLGPSLSVGNVEAALAHVRSRWTCCQIISLLKDKSCDVRKVAALALSLVGEASAIHPLAVALHDADPMVTNVAEHALW